MDNLIIEAFGVRIDARCAALLDVALNGQTQYERIEAIDNLAKLDCHLALGIVGRQGQTQYERLRAIDHLGKK